MAVAVCGDPRAHESQPEMEERMVVVVVVKGGGGPKRPWSCEGCISSHPPLCPSATQTSARLSPLGHLAGLHSQLLPVGRLLGLRL